MGCHSYELEKLLRGIHIFAILSILKLIASKFAHAAKALYPPTILFAKFTALIQIQRIFCLHKDDKNFFLWAVRVLIIINFVAYLGLMLGIIFNCWPREKAWNPDIPGKCLPSNFGILDSAILNVVSDITILVLPLIGIRNLRLSLKKKVTVTAVFATGGLLVYKNS